MAAKYRSVIFLSSILIITACSGVPSTKSPAVQGDVSRASSDIRITQPDSQSVSRQEYAQTLTEAIFVSGRIISESLDSNTSIAIISINAGNLFESEYALQELTYNLVRTQKFKIVERQNLDIIREEQQLHISGDVSDETAVSIGYFIGAAFVITGSIDKWDTANILRLRAINVETGQIKVMSSVVYGDTR